MYLGLRYLGLRCPETYKDESSEDEDVMPGQETKHDGKTESKQPLLVNDGSFKGGSTRGYLLVQQCGSWSCEFPGSRILGVGRQNPGGSRHICLGFRV